jgi:hypothetical protein
METYTAPPLPHSFCLAVPVSEGITQFENVRSEKEREWEDGRERKSAPPVREEEEMVEKWEFVRMNEEDVSMFFLFAVEEMLVKNSITLFSFIDTFVMINESISIEVT